MKFFRQQISVFLLAALAFLLVPNVLLHEMLEHHATEDAVCTDWCAEHVDSQHHHCNILQLTTPPFHQPVNGYDWVAADFPCLVTIEGRSAYHFFLSAFLFFRGPPILS